MQKRLFVIIAIITHILSISGHLNYKFRPMTPKGGLYYDGISKMNQDNNNFIWFIVGDNLYRFDGADYTPYNRFLHSNNTTSFSLKDITSTKRGDLIVASENGIYKHILDKNTFVQIDHIVGNTTLLEQGYTSTGLWMVTDNTLLNYDVATNRIDTLLFQGKKVSHIYRTTQSNHKTYFSTVFNRVYSIDNKDNSNNTVKLLYEFPNTYNIVDIYARDNKLWILVRDRGLFYIDLTKDDSVATLSPTQYQASFKGYENSLYVDKYHNVWIGTQQGLVIMDVERKEQKVFRHSEQNEYSLPNNSIWKIIEDKLGNVWIGTYSGGLCYVNLDEKEWFYTYNTLNSDISSNMISCFAEDENDLWIGTEGSGINRWNKKSNEMSHFTHSPKSNNSLPYNNIKSLALLPNGDLWIALFKGGLSKFTPSKNRFQNYSKNDDSQYKLLSNDLRKVIYDNKGGLWIIYQLNSIAISYIALKDNTITHYSYPQEQKGRSNNFIFDAAIDSKGDIYCITRDGIYTANKDADWIVQICHKTNLKNLNAQTCFIDNDQVFWLGTASNGLLKAPFNKVELNFTPVCTSQNYSTIVSLCKDDNGDIWFGTDNGLFKLGDKLYNYDVNEGFQGQVYYPLSSFKSPYSNWVYFGGTNGFTRFNPNEISPNTTIPNPIISNILVDNEPLYTNNFDSKGIVIDHQTRNFGFKVASDNYLIPSKNRFKYRLMGYDERWSDLDTSSRLIQFTKVPAGNYQLEVLTANNDGLWSESPLMLPIHKKSSPWLSWPAYSIYAIIIMALILGMLYYYYDKRKLKIQIYLNDIERNKQREIYNSQIQFFTNISHDFRTPLSLILGVVDNLKQEGLKEYYYNILRNNSNRLLGLVNELMDFRKVESGNITLSLSSQNINNLLGTISSDFTNSFNQKGIEYTVDPSQKLADTILRVDKNIIEKIVLNLLNNAIKYTKHGYVKISTLGKNELFISKHTTSFSVGELKGDFFSIIVEDSGIGITAASIRSVFDRFYQVPATGDKHLGTGVGLALVKSLVLLHGGEIEIYSEREKGTDFVVRLPYNVGQITKVEEDEDTRNTTLDTVIYDADITEKLLDSNLLFNEKKRILIVEDNPDLRNLLIDYLSPYYDMHGLPDGDDVADFLDTQAIDLIVSDIMMPIKDGVTLCKEIKESIETSHIPFILLTAKTETDSKIEGIGSGADLYMEKPIDFALLLISISNIFKQQEKRREYYAKNYFAEDADLSVNKQENDFLKKIIEIIDQNLDNNLDVNFISSEIGMSRSKLYSKLKTLTGKSIVEFTLEYKLRKAAKMMIEQDLSILEVMDKVGIKSQSYFTTAFKKEFGETPAAFILKHKKGV